MVAFWSSLLEPLAYALGPQRILEIGADTGVTTRALVEYAQPRGAVVHSIDPHPQFSVDELHASYPEAFVFHRALSLDVLPSLEPVDFALIDGDHNWHTILNELKLLEHRARDEETRPPLIALHDIDWPYGRRDLYYDPDSIPKDKRRPFQTRGMHPDSDELVDEGLNDHLANATLPDAQHSGVRGGIDDFMEQSKGDWRLFEIPGQHGLGILALGDLLEEHGRVRDLLEATAGAEFLRGRAEAIERARIDTEIRRVKAAKDASRARTDLDQIKKEMADDPQSEEHLGEAEATTRALTSLRDELDDAEYRARRFEKQRDSLMEREIALEEELAGERRKARIAKEEAEGAERRFADRERELEKAVAARTRLVSDFEEARESLVRALDEARAGEGTAHHAAVELREMLKERELEMQRVNAQLVDLQTALGRSQARAAVAEAERAAFERRLTDLVELHEAALRELSSNFARPSAADEPVAQGRVDSEMPIARPSLAEEIESRVTEVERDARRSFTTEYRQTTDKGVDPVALPSPHDRRGALTGPRSNAESRPSVDVVVCVHNALDDVRRCLWSLAHKASYPFHLIVVNDGSDARRSPTWRKHRPPTRR